MSKTTNEITVEVNLNIGGRRLLRISLNGKIKTLLSFPTKERK